MAFQVSFQNGLNGLFSSTFFYFKNKVIEVSQRAGGGGADNYEHFFSKCTFLRLWNFFSCLVVTQLTQFFQWQYIFIRFIFLMKPFPLNYQNAHGHQTFYSRDLLRRVLTRKYSWNFKRVVLCGHVRDKIHTSTCRKCIDIKLGKALTYYKRLSNVTLW